MKDFRAALAAACLAFTPALAAPAVAETTVREPERATTPASATDVRATIEAQLAAFRAGDADAAYALAAPGVKRMFPTPERFVRMVRRGYAPVYMARSAVFLRAQPMGDGGYAQEVGLTDDTGRDWTALYTLARQPDGRWLITGCYLRKANGQSI